MTYFTIKGYSWWLWLLPKFWLYLLRRKHNIPNPTHTQKIWKNIHQELQSKEELLDIYSKGVRFYEIIFNKVFIELGCRSLCDVGCGKGYWFKYIKHNQGRIGKDVELSGVDFNRARLNLLNTLLEDYRKEIDIRNEDILQGFSFSDNSFDVVTCLAFLPCFNEEEIAKVLEELIRITQRYIVIYEDVRQVVGERTNFGRPDILRYLKGFPVKLVFQKRISAPFMDPSELWFFQGWYGFSKRMITIVEKIDKKTN